MKHNIHIFFLKFDGKIQRMYSGTFVKFVKYDLCHPTKLTLNESLWLYINRLFGCLWKSPILKPEKKTNQMLKIMHKYH